jgi:hypothetical protein
MRKGEAMDYLNDLHQMCETLSRELGEANDKIRKNGGKLSGSDLEYVDKLTHALKSIKTTMAMIEAEGEGSYTGGSYADGYGGSYNNNGSYGRMSYARGRGGNARRDSMGRYSSRGYSRDQEMISELRELMEDAPDERTRQEFQRFISKIEQMG